MAFSFAKASEPTQSELVSALAGELGNTIYVAHYKIIQKESVPSIASRPNKSLGGQVASFTRECTDTIYVNSDGKILHAVNDGTPTKSSWTVDAEGFTFEQTETGYSTDESGIVSYVFNVEDGKVTSIEHKRLIDRKSEVTFLPLTNKELSAMLADEIGLSVYQGSSADTDVKVSAEGSVVLFNHDGSITSLAGDGVTYNTKNGMIVSIDLGHSKVSVNYQCDEYGERIIKNFTYLSAAMEINMTQSVSNYYDAVCSLLSKRRLIGSFWNDNDIKYVIYAENGKIYTKSGDDEPKELVGNMERDYDSYILRDENNEYASYVFGYKNGGLSYATVLEMNERGNYNAVVTANPDLSSEIFALMGQTKFVYEGEGADEVLFSDGQTIYSYSGNIETKKDVLGYAPSNFQIEGDYVIYAASGSVYIIIVENGEIKEIRTQIKVEGADKEIIYHPASTGTPTAISDALIQKPSKTVKTIVNGKLVIVRDGVTYDTLGRKL